MADVWAFSGESPLFMTLNFRMNAPTAAIGLAQLHKVDSIISTYHETLSRYSTGPFRVAPGSKPRRVPADARVAGYWFACTWDGEKHGLDYNKFKQINDQLKIGLRFGFNEVAPLRIRLLPAGHHLSSS